MSSTTSTNDGPYVVHRSYDPDTDSFEISVTPDITSELSVVDLSKEGVPIVGVKGPEDLARLGNVPEGYELIHYRPNTWPIQTRDPLFATDGKPTVVIARQARATFKAPSRFEQGSAEFLRRIEEGAPTVQALPEYSGARGLRQDLRHVLEVGVPDLHLGLYTYARETGHEYDLDIATAVFLQTVQALIQKSEPYRISKILFPIGNDFLNVDSADMATKNKTPMYDTAGSYQEIVTRGEEALILAIDMLKKVAPVDVIPVPGNHDETPTFFLARILNAYYRNDENVSIDTSPALRKYRRFGANLLGWTHGRYEKISELGILMGTEGIEQAQEVEHYDNRKGNSILYREWHLGHEHRLQQQEIAGVRFRWLPSLAAPSAWITRMGYNATVRAAEAYLWEYETGYAGHFPVTLSKDGYVVY